MLSLNVIVLSFLQIILIQACQDANQTLFNYRHRRADSDIVLFGRLEVPTSLLTFTIHFKQITLPNSNQSC